MIGRWREARAWRERRRGKRKERDEDGRCMGGIVWAGGKGEAWRGESERARFGGRHKGRKD